MVQACHPNMGDFLSNFSSESDHEIPLIYTFIQPKSTEIFLSDFYCVPTILSNIFYYYILLLYFETLFPSILNSRNYFWLLKTIGPKNV